MASINILQMLVPSSKYGIKCTYSMRPTSVTIHNTANDATAKNEVSYMIGNNNWTSYHYAVDEAGAVQGIPDNRNAWHCGNNTGNRNSLSIEICYSKSGGARFTQAEENAAILAAMKLKQYGLGIEALKTHRMWNGKNCPHRTDWNRFVNLVKKYMGLPLNSGSTSSPSTGGSISAGGTYTGGSIVDYLKSIGQSTSFANRAALAAKHGIANYTGTAAQNTQLLNLLRAGASAPAPSAPATGGTSGYTGGSIVEYLNSIGKASSFSARAGYAKQYGIANYTGTAAQNTQLLNAMRTGAATPSTPAPSKPSGYTGPSIVEYLNSIGKASSFSARAGYAKQYGISGYTGTAAQNTALLKKMRGF